MHFFLKLYHLFYYTLVHFLWVITCPLVMQEDYTFLLLWSFSMNFWGAKVNFFSQFSRLYVKKEWYRNYRDMFLEIFHKVEIDYFSYASQNESNVTILFWSQESWIAISNFTSVSPSVCSSVTLQFFITLISPEALSAQWWVS